ncbi:MAG: hypothetical protein HY020_07505, partial [Burkholderiales bacterium]|nr:hypothetical protein [Burkholderiales bacterium]
YTLKSQHPEYSDAKIREILDNKTPVGGIDCSYFFARTLFADSRVQRIYGGTNEIMKELASRSM